MGRETGLDFVNQLPNIESVIVDEYGKIYTSENIKLDKTKE